MVDRKTAGVIGATGNVTSTAAGTGIGALVGGPAGAAVGGMIGSGVGNLFSALSGLGAEEEFQGPSGGELSGLAGLQMALNEEMEQMGLTTGQVERQYQMSREQQGEILEQLGQLSQLASTPFEREGLAKVILGEARRVSTRAETRISELDIEADSRRAKSIAKLSLALSGVSSEIRRARVERAKRQRAFEAAKMQNFSRGLQASMQAITSGIAYGEERGLFDEDTEDVVGTTNDRSLMDEDMQSQIEGLGDNVPSPNITEKINEVLNNSGEVQPFGTRLFNIWRA